MDKINPYHPRFSLPEVPRPPELTSKTEQNPEQREAWKLNLFEWCCLMGDVEDLIREVEAQDASLAIPFNSAENQSH